MERIGAGLGHLVHLLAVPLAPAGGLRIVGRQILLAFTVHRSRSFAPDNARALERLRRRRVEAAMAPSASEAAAKAGKGDGVIGWKLDPEQRKELLQQFPPRFRNVVADHVTLAAKASRDAPLPQETDGEIVGRAHDGKGVEALVVSIGGTTDRPDGSTYHITWSLEDGRRAKESNDMLAARQWEMFDLPMPVSLRPARFP